MIKIEDVGFETIDLLVSLCVPSDRKDDPLFVEGMNAKRRWAVKALEQYGSIAKLAYLNSKPAGLIQYQPKVEEKLVEIKCIFVPEKENLRKGVGKALLNTLIEEAKKPKAFFGGDLPFALVTWAFEVPGRYPQHEFYRKMGFKRVREDDPFLLYYPIKEGYVYSPKEEEGRFIPQEEDKGRALIFYDPSCPFCIYFSEQIKKSIREVAPNIPIRMINMFEEFEEVKRRGRVPYCAVNGKPIMVFFMDKENFQKEVKEALKDS